MQHFPIKLALICLKLHLSVSTPEFSSGSKAENAHL